MHEQSNTAKQLIEDVEQAIEKLHIDDSKKKLEDLQIESQQPNFWQETTRAQKTMQEIAKLESMTKPWIDLRDSLYEAKGLIDLEDKKLQHELDNQLSDLQKAFDELKNNLKLSGPFDANDAIISIYAGAGGTDAQDWAQMLLRMYSRFFEKNNFQTEVIDQSFGEEAGLKSVTITVKGAFVYGKLKSENGVHRLVRLSPFNSDNLRQTSFAKVDVMPEIDQPEDLEIDEKDLRIDTFRSGGHGGQSVNTTDSAVRITHLPTGVVVTIQNERSQIQNKATAMTILRSKLTALKLEQHQEALDQLKGPNQSAEWGNQIRNYVLHPYKQVKDLRTKKESNNPEAVLDGDLQPFIDSYLDYTLKTTK